MHCFATTLVTLLLAVPAISVELFGYRYHAEDGENLNTFSRVTNRITNHHTGKRRRRNCGTLDEAVAFSVSWAGNGNELSRETTNA